MRNSIFRVLFPPVTANANQSPALGVASLTPPIVLVLVVVLVLVFHVSLQTQINLKPPA